MNEDESGEFINRECEGLSEQEVEDIRAKIDVGQLVCFRSRSIWTPGLVFRKVSKASRCYVWLGELRLKRSEINLKTRCGVWIPGQKDFAEMRLQRAQERWRNFIREAQVDAGNLETFLGFMDSIEAKLKKGSES